MQKPPQKHENEVLTISPNDRVHGLEALALIQGAAPDALTQRVAQPLGLVEEEGGVVGGRQALEHLLHGRAEAVIDLVARGPEGVASGRGQGVDLEHGVVGRHGLKRDVGVPGGRCQARHVGEHVGQAAALLLLLGRDDRDLVAQLRALLRQGVDVQT